MRSGGVASAESLQCRGSEGMKYRKLVRRHATIAVAIALVAGLYFFTRSPIVTAATRVQLTSNLRFTRQALLEAPHGPYRYVRDVHPSLKRISAWISSVGA